MIDTFRGPTEDLLRSICKKYGRGPIVINKKHINL